MMRKMRKIMLRTATFFQSFLRLSSTPALQESQLKHSSPAGLSQAVQSVRVLVVFVLFQTVGLSYWKLHSVGGLQHPDCNHNKQTIASDFDVMVDIKFSTRKHKNSNCSASIEKKEQQSGKNEL
uniref:Uncharacterized protein n=1 Tax=Nelumbo nucifera TaxID=4432 RepID=A0A822Y4W5_NELNU|nr:TPA_asm: hypothetical protein HUJ06_029048 [Nelumbo nucifera]